MADAEAGRLVPHEEAMVEIFGLIRKAEPARAIKFEAACSVVACSSG